MIKNIFLSCLLLLTFAVFGQRKSSSKAVETTSTSQKAVIYQVLPRLFGNKVTKNKPWGSATDNGVGKFNDFTEHALTELKKMGVTHLLLTGVLHHATATDYASTGISSDDPDVVKGSAGSPFAIKDYYQVHPDLAVNPSQSMSEFENLIKRCHEVGLKVILDVVPNHVARQYQGKNNPKGVADFGSSDDKSVEYNRHNNFYYTAQPFVVPETNQLTEYISSADGKFFEKPAKWSGNSTSASPKSTDWYDTVRLNFGVQPDGVKDFQQIPLAFATLAAEQHANYWKSKEIPDTWKKFHDITQFWLNKGVDGFRYEAANLVPYEFYSYVNSALKLQKPDVFLMAQINNPADYRNYVQLGKLDYVYGADEFYQTMKNVVQGKGTTDALSNAHFELTDIQNNVMHIVESHDLPRVASNEFARNGHRGKPLAFISATISNAPTLLYFGQEVGEQAKDNPGFGKMSTTSIYDYVSVPNHQRWMNGGKFDGGLLINEERDLRDFYVRLLNFANSSSAVLGEFRQIHTANREASTAYGNHVYSYVRWSDSEKLIFVTNFSGLQPAYFDLVIPPSVITEWKLKDGTFIVKDQLYGKRTLKMEVVNGVGKIMINIAPSESFIFKV